MLDRIRVRRSFGGIGVCDFCMSVCDDGVFCCPLPLPGISPRPLPLPVVISPRPCCGMNPLPCC